MEKIISIIVGLITIIGAIYVFFKWGINLIKKKFHLKDDIIYKIPKKTIIIIPAPNPHSAWWHMGSSSGKSAMQLTGRFRVTNITKYNILLTAAKMKNPKSLGHVMVKDTKSDYHGSYMIPAGMITDMSFDFWIMPPMKKEGESFFADVAILDQ